MYTGYQAIQQAASLLRAGKVVGIPTETVYGLGGSASSLEAIQKIYATKGRPIHNPLIIHISHATAIAQWAIDIPKAAWILAEHFWPGPLTLVLRRHPRVLDAVTANQDTVALRVPNHPVALALLQEFGSGIAAPSANRYGRISPTTAEHVREELGDTVDYVLEGGPCQIGIESTIVHCQEHAFKILRPGTISEEALSHALGISSIVDRTQHTIQVPGANAAHYAPTSPVFLLDISALLKKAQDLTKNYHSVGVLAFSKQPDTLTDIGLQWISASTDSNTYAMHLYANLRVLDRSRPNCILIETPPATPPWLAIQDRLSRASHSTQSGCC